jgi:hypothetical protein
MIIIYRRSDTNTSILAPSDTGKLGTCLSLISGENVHRNTLQCEGTKSNIGQDAESLCGNIKTLNTVVVMACSVIKMRHF